MRAIWIMLGATVAVVGGVAACISDEPADLSPVGDAGPEGDAGGAGDGGNGGNGCGPQTKAGGCSPSEEEYCFRPPAGPRCYPKYKAGESGCPSEATLHCQPGGASCGTGIPCCYGGIVRPGTTCAVTIEPANTDCSYLDPEFAALKQKHGNRPCLNGYGPRERLPILCENDDECARYDAGKCLSAKMGPPVDAIMGVCEDYDP